MAKQDESRGFFGGKKAPDMSAQPQPSNKNQAKVPPPPPPGKGGNGEKRHFTDEAGSGQLEKPAAADSTAPAADPAAVDETPAKVLTPLEKRALFDAVFATERGIEDAEAAVKIAAGKRTEAVKALIAGMGGKLGPWKVKDWKDDTAKTMRARVRGDTAYLLRPDEADVEVI